LKIYWKVIGIMDFSVRITNNKLYFCYINQKKSQI
jgi:hypothetical protein